MGGSSEKVTVGYKYYVGMHMALCHGPADKLVRIRVGGNTAWVGENTGGALTMAAPDLFGGEKREGGVTGQVDIEMGAPDQGQNSYLAEKLGSSLLPAFRGVCCAVLRQVYIGLNPYLKDWGWLVQRVKLRSDGSEQWYVEKAPISQYLADMTIPGDNYTLAYKEVVPRRSTWRFKTVPHSDTANYIGDPMMSGAIAPFFNILPHPRENPYEFSNIGSTVVPVHDTLWTEIDITLTDIRPVRVVIKADQTCVCWVNGAQIALSEQSDYMVFLGSFTPTSPENRITVKTVETLQDMPEEKGNYKYFDALLYQEETPVTDPSQYLFGNYSDMNPAHIIRECLTDANWGMGYPESDMGDSFVSAADALFAEGFGLSILWSQQSSLEDFVEDILRHIDAALYVNRATGKFEIKLIRNDYNTASLLVLDRSNVQSVENYTRQTIAELVNEVTVTYPSNETGQDETVTLQNLAMIQQQGSVVSANVDYPAITNSAVAARVAARDLTSLSTPLASATLVANRDAAGLNIGDVFRWNWQETDEDGIGVETSMILRVIEIAFGDGVSNSIRIQCVQDVFALPDIVYVEAEPTVWENPSVDPLAATPRLVMETPYYEIVRQLGEVDATAKLSGLPELGYLMIAAGRPAAEINAELYVDSGAGYSDGGTLDFCPCATLDGAIGYLDTTAALKDGVDLDEFVGGSLAQIGDEIIVIESITDNVATIRRGCLDTIPAQHADGAAVIIWDGYTASDGVEYVASDYVDVKILTIAGQGQLAIAGAPVDSVVMNQRAIRPYPPANVKIGGAYYPSLVVADDLVGIVVTWEHRDRLQQTGGTVLGWTDASVGPEAGVTYSARLVRTDTEAELDSATAISGTTVAFTPPSTSGEVREVRLEVWSVRDGLESFQSVAYTFSYIYIPQQPAYHGASQVYHGANEVYHEI